MSELLYGFDRKPTKVDDIDLRNELDLRGFGPVWAVLNSNDDSSYRVTEEFSYRRFEAIEFLIPKRGLRAVLIAHFKNYFLVSTLIALFSSFLLMLFLRFRNGRISKS